MTFDASSSKLIITTWKHLHSGQEWRCRILCDFVSRRVTVEGQANLLDERYLLLVYRKVKTVSIVSVDRWCLFDISLVDVSTTGVSCIGSSSSNALRSLLGKKRCWIDLTGGMMINLIRRKNKPNNSKLTTKVSMEKVHLRNPSNSEEKICELLAKRIVRNTISL